VRQKLAWKREVDFPALVKMMVDADLARLSRVPGTPAGVESR
jgi:GDP-D-mannose dehydratase